MKKLIKVLPVVLMGVGLLAGYLWLINVAQAAGYSLPTLIPSAQDLEVKPFLVDDFIDGNDRNNIGGKNECWAANGGIVACTIEAVGNEGFLKMEYDVNAADSYAVAATEVLSLNMTTLDTIWVAVRGEEGGEPIYVEVRDCQGQSPKEKISDHLAQDIDDSDYRAVAIPRLEYVDVSDWRCIDRLNIIPSKEIGSGQGTIYVDDIRLLPARVVVDDFHDKKEPNELGGGSGFWESKPNLIRYNYEDGRLRIDYDVTKTNPIDEAVYFTKFRNSNLLVRKDALSFNVRGATGAEEMAIEFRDCGLGGTVNIPKIKVSDYLVGGITTGWQTVSIPLAAFARGMDWRCVEQLNLLFSAQPWLKSGQGRVFIDDIVVAPTSHPIPLVIDRFDDCNKWNAQVWEWSKGVLNQATINFGFDAASGFGSRGCGLWLTYNIKGDSAGWIRSDLNGLDVSDYSHLRFLVKGKEGNEPLHVYLRGKDGTARYYEDIVIIREWQEVLIPLSYFDPAVTLENLAELTFAFEWKTMAGTIYLDDISFIEANNYLPVVQKKYQALCPDSPPNCSAPYNNYESNDFRCSTTAVLTTGIPIQSYICAANDLDDYYLIEVNQLGPISAQLTNLPKGVDYDIYLYFYDNIVAKSDNYGNTSESFGYSPKETGQYYLRVHPFSGYSLKPYTLQANFK